MNTASSTKTFRTIHGVAARYAQALYELAVEGKTLPKLLPEMTALENTLTPDLLHVLTSPTTPPQARENILTEISRKLKLSPQLHNFVLLVGRKNRLGLLADMLAGVRQREAAAAQRITAVVTSAAPLTSAQRKAIEGYVKQTHQDAKAVELVEEITPALVAGFKVRVGSSELDASIAGRLAHLRTTLKQSNTDI